MPSTGSGARRTWRRSRGFIPLDEIELLALEIGGCGGFEIRQEAGVGDACSLILRRQEGAAVVHGAAEVRGRIDRHVAGQILVVGAEARRAATSPCSGG